MTATMTMTSALPAEPRSAMVGPGCPWSATDRRRAMAGLLLGLIGLGLCWYGAGGESLLSDQMQWVAGAVLALAVLGLSALSWIVAGLRRVRLLRREVLTTLRAPVSSAARAHATAGNVLVGPAMTRFHAADCALARGKATREVPRARAVEDQLAPCPVCAP